MIRFDDEWFRQHRHETYIKATLVLVLVGLCLLGTLLIGACGKIGVGGHIDQLVGNWAEVSLPPGCKAKMIAADGQTTAVLCEDGRVFH